MKLKVEIDNLINNDVDIFIYKIDENILNDIDEASFYFNQNKAYKKKKIKKLLRNICIDEDIYKQIKNLINQKVGELYKNNLRYEQYVINAIYLFIDYYISEITFNIE